LEVIREIAPADKKDLIEVNLLAVTRGAALHNTRER
jgi:hypothetical protein